MMTEKEYGIQTLALGVGIAVAIVLVAIVAFNFGEISAIIKAEGLLSK